MNKYVEEWLKTHPFAGWFSGLRLGFFNLLYKTPLSEFALRSSGFNSWYDKKYPRKA